LVGLLKHWRSVIYVRNYVLY